jgi:hypothetical protein
MTEQKKEIKIEFAPGCFDNFDGTQEELQEMIAQIRQMAADGTLEQNSTPVDPEDEEFIKSMEAKIKPRQ